MKTLRSHLAAAVLAAGTAAATDIAQEAELMQAIAAYPADVRTAVLEVAQHPALLVKVQTLQERSSRRFAALMSGLQRSEEEAIWELVRHPGLLDELIATDGHLVDIDRVLEGYPASVQVSARQYAEYDLELLVDIQHLNERTDATFRRLLVDYPASVRDAGRTLIEHPDLMAALEEDMAATVLIGEAYRNDPGSTTERLHTLGLEAARQGTTPGVVPADTPFADVAAIYHARYAYDAAPIEARDEEVVDVIWNPPRPYSYWYGYPRWYVGTGWHASVNWYLTPHVSASVGFHPRFYAPRFRHPGSYVRHRTLRPVRVVYRSHDGNRHGGQRVRERSSRRGHR